MSIASEKANNLYSKPDERTIVGRNDYIYDYFFPSLMRYLILALADLLRHDYIELVREHRL